MHQLWCSVEVDRLVVIGVIKGIITVAVTGVLTGVVAVMVTEVVAIVLIVTGLSSIVGGRVVTIVVTGVVKYQEE